MEMTVVVIMTELKKESTVLSCQNSEYKQLLGKKLRCSARLATIKNVS